MLSAAVLVRRVAPTRVERATADASGAGRTVGRMRAELASLANVIRPPTRANLDRRR